MFYSNKIKKLENELQLYKSLYSSVGEIPETKPKLTIQEESLLDIGKGFIKYTKRGGMK